MNLTISVFRKIFILLMSNLDLSFRWFLSSLSTFVFFISPDAPPSALLIVFIPSDHALSLTSFFPQCQTTFKVVTLVPNLSSWVPLSAYEEFILKLCSRVLEWLTTDLMWKSKFFWFFTPTFTTILTSIKKEGVACLTWLSVRILWTWHVLKLHENLIISSSELNDKWEILIFTVVLDKIHSCASQDWHPLRNVDFTATLDLDRHRNDIS